MRINVAGDTGQLLFGKLYARTHLRADRWYKLGREPLYGRLEDEKPFNTVRRLVQQEDHMLLKMHAADCPRLHRMDSRSSPRTRVFVGHRVLRWRVELGQPFPTTGSSTTASPWSGSCGCRVGPPRHQAGQPAVRDGHVLLIDVFFAEIHPTPWRQAVDLANMMLCLALRSDPQRVYELALRRFSRRRSVRPSRRPAGWPCRPSFGGCFATRVVTSTPSS